MINESLKQNVITIGKVQDVNFTIAATAEAFDALSVGLYKNPHAAILRELGTNAYDAHVMAGKPNLPIEVHLPTPLQPTLIIRDYGPGLSKEALGLVPGVEGIYNTYFKSTKNNSNDYNGMFGVGSKSPFTMCESFLVTSYNKTGKFVCSVCKSESGTPQIICLAEEPPTNETGLKIEIPIASSDINSIRSEAIRIYKHFKVQPKITPSLSFPSYEWHSLTNEYGFVKKISYNTYSDTPISLLMGNVLYPLELPSDAKIDISKMKWLENKKLLDRWINSYNNDHQIVIFANIGDVSISLSREALRYDEKTNKFLEQRFTDLISNITKDYKDEFNKQDTWFDKNSCYLRQLQIVKQLVPYDECANNLWDYYAQHSFQLNLDNDKCFVEKYNLRYIYYGKLKKCYEYGYFNRGNIGHFNDNDLTIVINDITSRYGNYKKDYLVEKILSLNKPQSSIFVIDSNDSYDVIEKTIGIPKRFYVKVSDIEYDIPANVSATSRAAGYKGHYIWSERNLHLQQCAPEVIQNCTGTIYHLIKEKDSQNKNIESITFLNRKYYLKYTKINVSDILKIAKPYLNDKDLVIITTPTKLKKLSNTKSLNNYIVDCLKKVDIDETAKLHLVTNSDLRNSVNFNHLKKLQQFLNSNLISQYPTIGDILLADEQKIDKSYPPLYLLEDKIKEKIEKKAESLANIINKEYRKLCIKKPLLPFILNNYSDWSNDSYTQEIENYIRS